MFLSHFWAVPKNLLRYQEMLYDIRQHTLFFSWTESAEGKALPESDDIRNLPPYFEGAEREHQRYRQNRDAEEGTP